MTTAFLVVLWLDRVSIDGDIGDARYIVASYFFIPWPRLDGVMQPAFGLGWTLNYEMFFYMVFTPCVLLSRRPAIIVAGVLLCAFAAFGARVGFQNAQLAYWSNSIIIEFVAGMAIALCFDKAQKFYGFVRLILVVVAVVGLHFAVLAPAQWRALVYGLPAALLVCAAILGGKSDRPNGTEIWLIRLGDASYAMYLVHPFVMRLCTVLWHKFYVVNAVSGIIYVVLGLGAAQLVALVIHAKLEHRLSAVLRVETILDW